MKHLICILLLVLSCISCSQNKKNIKSIIVTTYNAEFIENKYVKKDMIAKYSVGRYPNGKQKFFVGLYGYQSNDTIFHKEANSKKMEEGEFIFFYQEDNLTLVTRKSKDTTFYYTPTDLIDFTGYDVYDRKDNLKKSYDALLHNEIEYTNYILDDCENPIYYVEKEEWLPDSILDEDLSPTEIAKKKIESRKFRIIEQEFKYF